jgi:hypothetical protein
MTWQSQLAQVAATAWLQFDGFEVLSASYVAAYAVVARLSSIRLSLVCLGDNAGGLMHGNRHRGLQSFGDFARVKVSRIIKIKTLAVIG